MDEPDDDPRRELRWPAALRDAALGVALLGVGWLGGSSTLSGDLEPVTVFFDGLAVALLGSSAVRLLRRQT